jgi:hypothetical protein
MSKNDGTISVVDDRVRKSEAKIVKKVQEKSALVSTGETAKGDH